MDRLTPTDHLSIGEVARRTGVAVSALHFYEGKGLIASVRTEGNQRRYPRYVLRRVSIIQVAKRLGIPLAEVAEAFADLPPDRMPSLRDWDRIATAWREQLRARREELERLEAELADCLGCGCLSLQVCRSLNTQDRLAVDGAGPRRLLAAPAEAE